MNSSTETLISAIKSLKEKTNTAILAHYYEDGEIQDLADYVGDSFYLAKMGQECEQQNILLAGVVFMGESVKILNPEKRVVVPDLGAGCSLVEGSPIQEFKKWREAKPNAIAVTYINSSAEVKALSDVIVTSSNAAQILQAIPSDREILFAPDENLGRYLSKKLNRPMTLWKGSCEVHVLFSAKKLFLLTQEHPEAVVLAHPECPESVLQYAHVIGSTSRLLDEVKQSDKTKYIVATEPGIIHQMRKAKPDAQFFEAPAEGGCACNNCPYMKLNTLEKIKIALETMSPEIKIEPALAEKAKISLDRMMNITSGKPANW